MALNLMKFLLPFGRRACLWNVLILNDNYAKEELEPWLQLNGPNQPHLAYPMMWSLQSDPHRDYADRNALTDYMLLWQPVLQGSQHGRCTFITMNQKQASDGLGKLTECDALLHHIPFSLSQSLVWQRWTSWYRYLKCYRRSPNQP